MRGKGKKTYLISSSSSFAPCVGFIFLFFFFGVCIYVYTLWESSNPKRSQADGYVSEPCAR